MSEHTNTGLVSIVMPLFNGEKYVSSAIESVQKQTYDYWELLIIDDCSTDNGFDLVSNLAALDNRIQLFNLSKTQGAGAARNKGIKEARGHYIAFLDADDRWLPIKLELQLNFMRQNGATVCHSSYRQIDENGNPTGTIVNAIPFLSCRKQHINNYIGNLTGIYDAQKLGKIYAPLLRKRQDWALWLEAVKKSGKPCQGIPKILAEYRIHSDNMSGNKIKLLKYNFMFYKKYLGYGVLPSSYWLIRFLIEYFFVRPKYISKEVIQQEN